jgi:hypothetical protein
MVMADIGTTTSMPNEARLVLAVLALTDKGAGASWNQYLARELQHEIRS